MSFQKKIDKVLEASKLLPGKRKLTINKIETELGIESTIRKNYNADTYPTDEDLIPELIRKFGINPEWWQTEQGEVFIVKGTPVTESVKKNTDREEISILIKNLNRYGETNEYLMKRIKDLEDFIKSKGLATPI